jgi:hypothetical protein
MTYPHLTDKELNRNFNKATNWTSPYIKRLGIESYYMYTLQAWQNLKLEITIWLYYKICKRLIKTGKRQGTSRREDKRIAESRCPRPSRRTNRQTNEQTDGGRDRHLDRRMNRQMEEETNRQTDRRRDRHTIRQKDKQTDEWTDRWRKR